MYVFRVYSGEPFYKKKFEKCMAVRMPSDNGTMAIEMGSHSNKRTHIMDNFSAYLFKLLATKVIE